MKNANSPQPSPYHSATEARETQMRVIPVEIYCWEKGVKKLSERFLCFRLDLFCVHCFGANNGSRDVCNYSVLRRIYTHSRVLNMQSQEVCESYVIPNLSIRCLCELSAGSKRGLKGGVGPLKLLIFSGYARGKFVDLLTKVPRLKYNCGNSFSGANGRI